MIHVPSGLKADFFPSRSHPYFAWAMAHRRRLALAGEEFWFAPPEYVILWKLEFYREGRESKHLRDIRGILSVSRGELDLTMLARAVVELRLDAEWAAVIG